MLGEEALKPSRKHSGGHWLLGAFRRFPVTTLVLLPYLVLVLPQAIVGENPETGFIIEVLSWALLGSIASEVLLLPRYFSQYSVRTAKAIRKPVHSGVFAVARIALLVSGLAGVLDVLSGGGTIFSQVAGGSSSSAWGSLLTLFGPWKYIGVGFLIVSFLKRHCSSRQLFFWLSFIAACSVFEAFVTAITKPLISFLIFVALVLFYFGIFRLRNLVVGGGLLLMAWPTIFAVRNKIRLDGGVAVSRSVDAADRLRFDEQISRAAGFSVPNDLGQPGVIELIRYGLIPRLLDPSRPPISTGSLINVYLGGSAESSFTFLPVTTLYFLEGPGMVVAFYALWALFIAVLMKGGRLITPVRTALFCLAVAGPLQWFAGYPDSTIGFLQGAVSMIPLVALYMSLPVVKKSARRSRESERPVRSLSRSSVR